MGALGACMAVCFIRPNHIASLPTCLPSTSRQCAAPLLPTWPQDCAGYGLLAPLIDGDSFRASLRPPGSGRDRRRGDPPGSLLLRLESGDESVRSSSFAGGARGMVSQGRVQQNKPASLPVCNSRLEGVLDHYQALPALALPLPTGVLYAAASSDPFELLDRGVTAAARLSGETGASSAPSSLAWWGASCRRQ